MVISKAKIGAGLLLMTCLIVGSAGRSETRPYDGELIFRGVLLGIGPVAKLFPEYYSGAGGVEEQHASAVDHVVASFREHDPAYFDQFAKDMQSGDLTRISLALDKASQTLGELGHFGGGSGGHGWDSHGHGAGSGPPWLLAKWSDMPDLDKDVLVARVAQRLTSSEQKKS